MDENPCTEMAVREVPGGLAALWAGFALSHMLDGNPERAERCLRAIPRNRRGDLNKAFEDLQMLVGRLG